MTPIESAISWSARYIKLISACEPAGNEHNSQQPLISGYY